MVKDINLWSQRKGLAAQSICVIEIFWKIIFFPLSDASQTRPNVSPPSQESP